MKIVLIFLGAFFLFLGGCSESPEEKAERELQDSIRASREEQHQASIRAERSMAAYREEALRERDKVDAAIRDDVVQRRKDLEGKSVQHSMKMAGNIRTDLYTMNDGRSIVCTTVVYDTGPIMECN